jgi:hypothetical protein
LRGQESPIEGVDLKPKERRFATAELINGAYKAPLLEANPL